MPLILTLSRVRGGPAGRETRTLSTGTLSNGRAAGNDWVLADPDRHLSKTHCVISRENGRYVLTDLSTNGVHVNGALQATERDSRVVLTDGDEFRLGDYSVAVAEADDPTMPGASADPFGAQPDPLATAHGGDGPLDADPFDGPLGAPSPGFGHPPPAPRPVARQDDPVDLADDRGRHPDPEDDLFRGATPLNAWRGPAQPDNADAPRHAFAAPRVRCSAPWSRDCARC